MTGNALEIAKEIIPPGRSKRIDIPVSRLPTQTLLSLPVKVVNGAESGAKLWLSAAIHGDELNGVEIIRQVLEKIEPEKLILFRKHKDPTILKPEVHPIFIRLSFLDVIEDNADTEVLEKK